MTKQPSIYNLLGGYKVFCLPGSKYAWQVNRGFKAFRLTQLVGKPAIFFFITLTVFLFTGFKPVRNNLVSHEKQVPTVDTPSLIKKEPSPISFEYAGLFHLKVVIKPSADHSFFSNIEITTTAEPSSIH
jgi:hypothetical protein